MRSLLKSMFQLLLACSCLFSMIGTSTPTDTIAPGRTMKDGETLVSAGGTYELGFFSPGKSKSRYLGIWFKNMATQTVVWVANREAPISGASGVLNMTSQGILLLSNGTNSIFWSSNASRIPQNPMSQLLDSGNLVVKDRDDTAAGNILWQSFDHPSDTLLQGMKLGKNFITGQDWILSSWKSADDPAQGDTLLLIDPPGFPQMVVMKGNKIFYRVGSWNGLRFTVSPETRGTGVYSSEFILNANEVYYTYERQSSSIISRLVVNQSGSPLQHWVWTNRTHSWSLYSYVMMDNCNNYGFCGAYAICNTLRFPLCECFEGFVPKSPIDWSLNDFSQGCVRRIELNCTGDGFLKHSSMKLPDTSDSWFDTTMNLEECNQMCFKNCSCTAYANSDVRGRGSGCVLWFGDLIDSKEFIKGGQDLFIRVAASELGSSKKKKVRLVIAICVVLIVIILVGLIFCIWRKKLRNKKNRSRGEDNNIVGDKDEMELRIFDLATVAKATANFSRENRLGGGGFGSVYKGTFAEGQEAAVKRLSKSSGQGMEEFKNEVILIAKLQHRNLVKLLGCCTEGDEKMLIYEYMPNKSLDYFIFDETRSKLIDWQKRMQIISGIARGLLYLHQDSRLRIVHRDLKASNVLLDSDMNPKISDFGLARMFQGDQTGSRTRRVVGTYGYMSPEYAVDGHFSIKSDVFSFGVIVLEIVSGKKNRGFSHSDHSLNLLGHAWKLWMEDRPLELIDSVLCNSYSASEVLRCIHVSLLCVQKRPEDRPNMSSVVLMLGSENSLPKPKIPGFFAERILPEGESSSQSRNEFTVTLLEPR